ncbi:MAG: hypothetical protein DRJ64_05545 [Thermoprotei archaeon]|nr:MAG: hypothetical protein DRJ64_05545 [Thermoprotei archaeon]
MKESNGGEYLKRRFLRQIILDDVGEKGQRKLMEAKVLIVGVGATGCAQAELLARMGVGEIRIVDPDRVEESNLHRQTCYDEGDLGRYKAARASEHLSRIHPHTIVVAAVGRIEENWREIAPGVDIILDGTDCVRTRYFLNELSVHLGIPWVFTGVAGAFGQSVLLSPDGPCLACFLPENATLPTCDTEGVFPTLAVALSAISAHTAVKYLLGRGEVGVMKVLDINSGRLENIKIAPKEGCSVHEKRVFKHLDLESK